MPLGAEQAVEYRMGYKHSSEYSSQCGRGEAKVAHSKSP